MAYNYFPQLYPSATPNDIIQYLLNSGQVSQNQINAVMQQMNNPNIRGLFR